jgi:hypothetical protein
MKLLQELLIESKHDKKVKGEGPKPRNQQLHQTLSGRKGGRMKSAKDYDRRAGKRDMKRAMNEQSGESYGDLENRYEAARIRDLELQTKIGSILIKAYQNGGDKETIGQMGDRAAKMLGMDGNDPTFRQAWMSVIGDTDFDELEADADYTDQQMRRGEMGM